MKKAAWYLSAAMGVFAAIGAGSASANEFEPQIREMISSQLKSWVSDPVIIAAIKAQNDKHASLDAGAIDTLDKQWRAEAKAGGSGPLIDATLANDLSKFLKTKKEESGGLFSEVFVMDNKGLNVGQSDVTSDYMQGDEAKWQKTYGAGSDSVFIDEVEFDDSTEAFLSQVSLTIADGGTAIGAITIGVNVEKLP